MQNILSLSFLTVGLSVLCTCSPAGPYAPAQPHNTIYRGAQPRHVGGIKPISYGHSNGHRGNQILRPHASTVQGRHHAPQYGAPLVHRGLEPRNAYSRPGLLNQGGHGAPLLSSQHQPLSISRSGPLVGHAGGHYGSPSDGHYKSTSHYESKQQSSSYGSSSPHRSLVSSGPISHYAGIGHLGATGPYGPAGHGAGIGIGSQLGGNKNYGREMKYTIRDPYSKGTTHVTETHIVSNREMHGQEAEAAMKKLMGSMGPGHYGHGGGSGFHDLVNGVGLPYF